MADSGIIKKIRDKFKKDNYPSSPTRGLKSFKTKYEGSVGPKLSKKDKVKKLRKKNLASGGLVSKLRNGGTSDDDKKKVSKKSLEIRYDGPRSSETNLGKLAVASRLYNQDVVDEAAKNRSRRTQESLVYTKEPASILKSMSESGRRASSDLSRLASQKVLSDRRRNKYSKELSKRFNSGGSVGKLRNGGLGIQSYDDNLKKGGLARKARKKY